MSVNWALPFEERLLPADKSKLLDPKIYLELHKQTVENFKEFWAERAKELPWFKPWDRVLDDSNPPFYKWFVGAETNASWLCLDRHVASWRKNKVAIIWEGEPLDKNGKPLEIKKYTYADLYKEVNRVAYLLKTKYNLKKGDTVTIYLPMIPELPIFMLACARLGVVFNVVFAGFSSASLSDRINDSKSALLITADGFWRNGKILHLKDIADEALKTSPTIRNVIVVRRLGNKINIVEGRDAYLDDLLREVPENVYVEPTRLKSEDPLYILYTSGTTGKPKGQVHDIGGYMVLLDTTMKWAFDVRDEDVYWCTADIGWVTGHSYIVFGPLMEGVTEIIYEGSLTYPDAARWAAIIERYGVTILYTSPTAIRGWMKNPKEFYTRYNLASVRVMHSVGEPINPEAFRWFYEVVGKNRNHFGSTWWMTETGGLLTAHWAGLYTTPMKPGTNGMPLFGVDLEVVDDKGDPQRPEERGYLVIRKPWPGLSLTIWGDPQRFIQVYFSRFKNHYFWTGDYAVRDRDGYFWILGRADEVIKVAGHRLGTYELESTLIQHPAVAEAAVVGIPDEIKGEVPVAFVILRQGYTGDDKLATELNNLVRAKVGPIATLKTVIFVSKLPKTRSAKIMRRVVQAVATNRPIGDVTTLEDEASVDEVKKAYLEFLAEVEKIKSDPNNKQS
ncbi:MAG TPA: acetate--CoA ligase [Geobacterales bacterium]|nr:acetate--CoA ligase [Geobacterales bacterium]